MRKYLNIGVFQREVGDWHRKHFPNVDLTEIVLKAVEEVAELATAHNRMWTYRKNQQGKLSYGGLTADEMDAIGDIVIVLITLCERAGVDFALTVESVWWRVKQRSAERIHWPSTVADSLSEAQP